MNKKIFSIGILGILLLMCTSAANTLEYNTRGTLENDPTYVGHMSVEPGDFPLYENWELSAEVNPDFGGEEKTFYLKKGEPLTLTATYEVIEDAFGIIENWKFTLYTYRWKDNHWDPIKYDLEEVIDEPGPDNACSGELSVTIAFNDDQKIIAKLWIDYWRLGWDGSEDEVKDTDVVNISIFDNQKPTPPIITGPKTVKAGTLNSWTFVSTDPDGDDITYYVDWGDICGGAEYHGPYPSGEEAVLSHRYTVAEEWIINAMAIDDHGAESEESYYIVTVKNSRNLNSLFMTFIHKHPILYFLINLGKLNK